MQRNNDMREETLFIAFLRTFGLVLAFVIAFWAVIIWAIITLVNHFT